MTSAAALEIPEELAGGDIPDVLLGYQKRLHETTAINRVTVCEKSRRIGITWDVASDAVLTSATKRRDGGMDSLYIGYNLDMAREFIDCCGMWSRAFNRAASDVSEFMFEDEGAKSDEEKYIKAFRVTFASGFEIVALSSRPRSLRGRQGYLIIDEAAFHDDLPGLLKAGLAFLIWGGKILVISTHNGADHPFNELVNDCRAGRRPYAVVRITFDDAIADGLYERVCLVTGEESTPEGKAEWIAGIRADYGDDADEELDCIPRKSGGKYLPRSLIESRMVDAPVLRWSMPDTFVDEPEHIREAECRDWCDENLLPALRTLDPARRTSLGGDFGRSGDLSVFWPLQVMQSLVRRTPFTVELRNIPFDQQRQILFYVCDRLPRLTYIALDARGNGQYLAEKARQEYGSQLVDEVMLTANWYLENFPRLKAALEDRGMELPRDDDVLEDLRQIEVIQGVPRIPDKRTRNDRGQRHGDAAVAAVLAYYASLQEGGVIDFESTGRPRTSMGGYLDEGQSPTEATAPIRPDVGFGVVGGGINRDGYV